MGPWATDLWRLLWVHYHRDWFDPATIVFAILYVIYKSVRLRRFSLSEAARFMMDGAAVFPLTMLSLSALSRHALESLLNGNRAILSIAGVFALAAVLQMDKRA